jgi:hypothetical protein
MNNDLKIRYLKLYPSKGLNNKQIQNFENKLSIMLPEDVKNILDFYDGYYSLAYLSLYSFDQSVLGWNICDETLRLRQSINLPKNMIVLAEPDESIIIMEISNEPKVMSKIYWLGSGDIYNLAEGKPLEDNPTIFPTFSDFFAYLLDEEEKRRTEEKVK